MKQEGWHAAVAVADAHADADDADADADATDDYEDEDADSYASNATGSAHGKGIRNYIDMCQCHAAKKCTKAVVHARWLEHSQYRRLRLQPSNTFTYLWLVGNGGMGYNYNHYYYHSSIPH